MQTMAILTAILATAPSVLGWTFTACNGGCTGSGCKGTETTYNPAPGDSQNIPGTMCIIWAAGLEASDWIVCNKENGGGSCTDKVNVHCFAAQDGSGRTICDTPGTRYIKIVA